ALAERKGVRLDTRREGELEDAVADLAARRERVEPVTVHAQSTLCTPVDEQPDETFPPEHEVDLARGVVKSQPGSFARDDPFALDSPLAVVGEVVACERRREVVVALNVRAELRP